MIRLIMVILAFTLGISVILGPFERAIVYPFDSTQIDPKSAGVPQLKETKITIDGETLILWVAPPKSGKPVILYFHGNAGNLANRTGRFRHFLAQGYGLIAPAYRGSSGSTGTPSETALRSDALTIYRQIPSLLNGKSSPIALYGESLGTGVVIALNADLTNGDTKPKAIILEAPYTSIPDIALVTYPALAPLIGKIKNRWDSLGIADQITVPLLILHGNQDVLIPQKQGRAIFAAAQSHDKDFVSVKGAGHTNVWNRDTLPTMWKFIARYAIK